jgi:hypothetical protein
VVTGSLEPKSKEMSFEELENLLRGEIKTLL